MDTLQVTIPETMKAFIDDCVSKGRYSDASAYIRELIQADQRRRAEERLDALLLEGLNSGEPIEATAEYWERKKQALVERTGQRENS